MILKLLLTFSITGIMAWLVSESATDDIYDNICAVVMIVSVIGFTVTAIIRIWMI
jgi:hypothetical protein